jgi:hypothetical protein
VCDASCKRAFFFKKLKKEKLWKSKSTILEAQCRWLPEEKKQYQVQKKRKRSRTEMERPDVVSGMNDNCATRWW